MVFINIANASLTIGTEQSDDIKIELSPTISISDVSCNSEDIFDNVGFSTVATRTVNLGGIPEDPEDRDPTYTFTLTCWNVLDRLVDRDTATITLVTGNPPAIQIKPDAIPITSFFPITTSPATLTIGTAPTDDIRLTLRHVELEDVFCYVGGSTGGFDGLSITGRTVTLDFEEGTARDYRFALICQADTIVTDAGSQSTTTISNNGQIGLRVNIPIPVPTISIEDQTVTENLVANRILSIGNTPSDDIQIELENADISDVVCTESFGVIIPGATPTTLSLLIPIPSGTTEIFELTCVVTVPGGTATATATITLGMASGDPTITIADQTIDVSDGIELAISTSGPIVVGLENFDIGQLVCRSSNIGNIGSSAIGGLTATINLPTNPEPSYTFTLTCFDRQNMNTITDTATITLVVSGVASITLNDQTIDITGSTDLTIGPSGPIVITLLNVNYDDIVCSGGGGPPINNIGSSQINNRGVTINLPENPASSYTFSLRCSTDDVSSRTATITLNIVASTAPPIVIPSGQSVPVTTSPATLTIGTAPTDDIQIELSNVDINDVTCAHDGGGFAGLTITGRTVTVTYSPGTSGGNNLELVCSVGSFDTAIVRVQLAVNIPAVPTGSSITIPDGQEISITTTSDTFTIGNTAGDDIQIELTDIALDDVTCTTNNGHMIGTSVSERTVTIERPAGTVVRNNLQLECSAGGASDDAFISLQVNIPTGPSISISDQTVDIFGSTDLTIGTDASADIRVTLNDVDANNVTCSSSDIVTNIGAGNSITSDLPATVTIVLPANPATSYTFELTCEDGFDTVTSGTGTSGTGTITLMNTQPSISISDQPVDIISSTDLTIGTEDSYDIKVDFVAPRNAEFTCSSDNIATNIGTGSSVSGTTVVILLPDDVVTGQYTFELTCTYNDDDSVTDSTTITINLVLPITIIDPNYRG